MGFTTPVKKVFDFIYKADFSNGLTEYEFDHVFVGYYDGMIEPNENEVYDYMYKSIPEIESMLKNEPELFTVWFHIAFPKLKDWWMKNKAV